MEVNEPWATMQTHLIISPAPRRLNERTLKLGSKEETAYMDES